MVREPAKVKQVGTKRGADAAPQKTVIKRLRGQRPRPSVEFSSAEFSSADAEQDCRILPISDASGRVLLGQTQLKLKFPTSYAAADPAKSSPFPNPTLSSLWQVVRKR